MLGLMTVLLRRYKRGRAQDEDLPLRHARVQAGAERQGGHTVIRILPSSSLSCHLRRLRGALGMQTFLAGMPQCKLGLIEKMDALYHTLTLFPHPCYVRWSGTPS